VENYVYDGDQLVAVLNAIGAIQHEYFDSSSLDQVFADQTVLSCVPWPLEDRQLRWFALQQFENPPRQRRPTEIRG